MYKNPDSFLTISWPTGQERPKNFDKVRCIKILRSVSGFGLKEAKDALELAERGDVQRDIPLTGTDDHIREAIRELHANGYATGKADPYQAIIDAATAAIERGEYALAADLSNVLDKHIGAR